MAIQDMTLSPVFFDAGESALLVHFGSHYNKTLSFAILRLSERIERQGLPGVRESIPALTTMTVFFDPFSIAKERLMSEIADLCASSTVIESAVRTLEIPVVYGGNGGPDLSDVAGAVGVPESEIVTLHSGIEYHVYMLGFLPGFAYLGDLPSLLRLPRRSTPRSRVPTGSVAIASDMTAIYPLESPGGWHILGATPVALWDMARFDEPLFQPGDRVRFKPIGDDEARDVAERVARGWRPAPTISS